MTALDPGAPDTARRPPEPDGAAPPATGAAPTLQTGGPPKPARAPRPSPSRESRLASAAMGWALAGVAGLAVWFVLFAIGLSALTEHHDQSVLYAQLRQEIAKQTAPVGAPIARGAPVAVLSGPHLSRQVVVEGTDSATLRSGPGLFPGYVLPGQSGVAAVFGRSTTFGAPFRDIHELKAGDRLAVSTGQGNYTYRVVGTALAGQTTPAPFVAASAKLLLVTSDDSGFLGVPAPGRTQYVYAVLVGTPGADGSVQTPSASDKPNATLSSELYPLVLWLQLVVVLALAGTWMLVRGPRKLRPHTWVVGTPLVLAALWGASDSLFGLLPNLI